MSTIDWVILVLTLSGIILFGVYKSKSTRSLDGYFLSNREMPWWIVLLSIMGTQASAVTFLSAPGQAYTDGMRFVQYYFGLPLAMVVLCVTFLPIFHRLKVYTAYEFLEQRFDVKTRTLTSFLFLLSRGLSTGISVYAPAIILSSLLGWNIYITNIVMGGLLIIYTVSGGAKAVAFTQQIQLIIVFVGMFLAGYMVVNMLPENVGFTDALQIGGKMGKFNVITTGFTEKGFDWTDRFNIFSGVIGGFFLMLSYFGTDQSQVGRYLTAKSIRESRMGLLMNGIVKVPMQFLILMVGVLVFSFYQFNSAPIFFNDVPLSKIRNSPKADSLTVLQNQFDQLTEKKKEQVSQMMTAIHSGSDAEQSAASDSMSTLLGQQEVLRNGVKKMIVDQGLKAESSDTNYIFIRFVVDHLPKGLIGLLIAVIFLAAWGSIAAALNSLSSATVVDFHKKFINKNLNDEQDYKVSRWYTFFWGVFCIVAAEFFTGMGSLIEAVNILGSWFYGVMLGIFLVAFYLKSIRGNAVFTAALIGEAAVIGLYSFTNVGWLWLNVVGAIAVVIIAILLQYTVFRSATKIAVQ
jgi:solute:Na+ symporter, SSS family